MNQMLIDVNENELSELDVSLLDVLISDKTSGKHIKWATDNYRRFGSGYSFDDYIETKQISGIHNGVIKPRTCKTLLEQSQRKRNSAEVFTPSWICNKQNNMIDSEWFGFPSPFNKELDQTWETNEHKIQFPEGKTWMDYVSSNRLEVSCGEAPYLVSRYDTVTGEFIPLNRRIGILDRKIRLINENSNDDDWYDWVLRAFKSTYGFELQGDNVLLARENLLYSFIDYYEDRFGEYPPNELLMEIADVITWNIWQMDGMKFVIPHSCITKRNVQHTLFGGIADSPVIQCPGCVSDDIYKHNGIYCKIMDWEVEKRVKFIDIMIKGGFQ